LDAAKNMCMHVYLLFLFQSRFPTVLECSILYQRLVVVSFFLFGLHCTGGGLVRGCDMEVAASGSLSHVSTEDLLKIISDTGGFEVTEAEAQRFRGKFKSKRNYS